MTSLAAVPQGSPGSAPRLPSLTAAWHSETPLHDPNTWDAHKSDLSQLPTARLSP